MKTIMRPHQVLLVCALAIAGVAATGSEAFASHFRYGSMTWQVVNPAQPNVVKVRFDSVFRWSFPWGDPPTTCPGPPFVATGGTGTGGCPPVGTVIASSPGQITSSVAVRVGTNPTPVMAFPLTLTVTSINSTEDWFTGTFETTLTFPAASDDHILEFANSARISTLRDDNQDKEYKVRTRVTVRMPPAAVNQPPTVATLPVLTLALNQPASFPIAASDPNGDRITFSIPPTAETGLRTPSPLGFSLTDGVVTWTPTVAGLYAVQIKASDDERADEGAYTVADFILNVKPLIGLPPVVRINGTPGPKTTTVVHGTPVTFTVQGIDPENTPVLLSHAGLPPGATTTPSLPVTAVGAMSTFHWTPAQADIGNYVLIFAALDGDGRQAVNSMTITVTGNPPAINCTASGPVLEATSPAGAQFDVTATVSDPDGDALTLIFFVDGIQRQLVGPAPPTPVTHTGTFGLGNHTYEARVSDGLTTQSCKGPFSVVDTRAPVLTVTPGDQRLPATSPAGGVATFTATAIDQVDPTPTVICSHPSGAVFPIGMTTVTCTARDAAGNSSAASFVITVLDDVAPSLTVPGNITAEATGPVGAAVSFVTSATDAINGMVPVLCSAVSGDTFPLGSTTVDCSATDESGNKATASFVVTVVDTTAPAFTVPADITAEATSAAGAVVGYVVPIATDAVDVIPVVTCLPPPGGVFALGVTVVSCTSSDLTGNSTTHSFRVTVVDTTPPAIAPQPDITVAAQSAAGTAVSYTPPPTNDAVGGAGTASCNPPSGTTFPLGVTTVTCSATDAAGNHTTSMFTVTVFNSPPTFTPPAGISTPATSPAGATVIFVAMGNDAEEGPIAAVCMPPSGLTFPLGLTLVNCTVTDRVGSIASGSFPVVVTNNPPAFVPPANITLPATGPAGAVATFTAAGNDVEDGVIAAICTPPSGSTFPIGATTVNCTVTDVAGATTAGSFTVTVTNNPPTFTPPANITVQATGPTGAVATFTATGSDVEDGPITAVCVPPSGSTFPIGTTTVNCTVTDVAGATASGAFTVKVVDTTPPEFTRPPLPVTISQCRTPNLGVVTATDAQGPVTVTNNAPAVFPLGTTIVTWTATDAAGNKVTVTQTVTAILGDDPSCCPPNTNIILGTNGSDVLVGTMGRDCILLRGGNDVCNAFGGDDYVSGGDGDDVIDSGDGNDVVFGGAGRDTIMTGNGNDRIDGGPGNDICNGGGGSNTVVACEP